MTKGTWLMISSLLSFLSLAPLSCTDSSPVVALDAALSHLSSLVQLQLVTFLRLVIAKRVLDSEGLCYRDVRDKVHSFSESDVPLTMAVSEGLWDQQCPLVLQAWILS